MDALKTYQLTYSPHFTPDGQALSDPAHTVHTPVTTTVRALHSDGAVDTAERAHQRMVTSCRRIPCQHTPAGIARMGLLALQNEAQS